MRRRPALRLGPIIALALILVAGPVFGQKSPPEDWSVTRSGATGLVSFLSGPERGPLPFAASAEDPLAILRSHGAWFGISDPDAELTLIGTSIGVLGHVHRRFQQVHRGIPVFTGQLLVHQRPDGTFLSVNGGIFPVPGDTPVLAELSSEDAAFLAAGAMPMPGARAISARLVIADPAWYGDPAAGVRLAWHLVLEAPDALDENVLVDAIDGTLLDRWPAMHSALDREVYDGTGGGNPGTLVRAEGDPAVGDVDADAVYDFAGDFYRLMMDGLGRDGVDGTGGALISTVHWDHPICPNAVWNGSRTLYCDGLANDDVVAHEFAHGLTQFTAGLVYQNQSGQLNESFSDVFGELVDLWNGNASAAGPPGGTPWPPTATGGATDTPNDARVDCADTSIRWKMGEDTSFGAIRDMWQPDCNGHPPSSTDPLYQSTCCDPNSDSGGVHRGSGVTNHAFAILTDGKSYNGQTVTGIGAIKAGAIWFRALTVYLTPGSQFTDAYAAFNQAAADLLGTTPDDPRTGLPSASAISATDVTQVDLALLAVELNNANPCNIGPPPPNDDCLTSEVVAVGLTPFDSSGATDSGVPFDTGICPGTAVGQVSRDVWFEWTAPSSGLATISTCDIGNFDTDLIIYVGDCGSLLQIACDGDTSGCANFTSIIVDLPVTGGETYRIRIGGWGFGTGGVGEFSIDLTSLTEVCDNGIDDDGDGQTDCDDSDCIGDPACAPWPGDECVDALPVVLGPNPIDTSGATDSPEPPGVGGCPGTGFGSVGSDVWYSYTTVEAGILTVSTCGTIDFDSDLVIYSGTCGALAALDCNGNGIGCPLGTSIVDFPVDAGISLFIRLGGASGGTGSLDLSFFIPPPPEVCDNGVDDDLDGLTDCADPDCVGTPECVCLGITGLTCTQGATDLSVDITWGNGELYDSITVQRDGVVLATLPGTDTTYTDPAATLGMNNYVLTAQCGGVSSLTSCLVDVVEPPRLFRFIAPMDTVEYPESSGVTTFSVELAIVEEPDSFEFPNDTQGFSMGLAHDSVLLTVVALTPSGPLVAMNGGTGPEFVTENLLADGWNIGVVFSFGNTEFAQFLTPTPVLSAEYETVGGPLAGAMSDTVTALTWSDTLGTPAVENVTVVTGASLFPAFESGSVTLVPVVGQFDRGDCNADTLFNVADPITSLGYLFSGGSVSCLDACDANDDGMVNIADGIYTLATLFTQGPNPPAPHGACGADPTSDALECDSYDCN